MNENIGFMDFMGFELASLSSQHLGAAQGVFFCPSCPPDRCHGVMRWRAGALLVSRALGADLLILGDSWAELAGTTFSEHCPGSRVFNVGVGGSTAAQWARTDFHEEFPDWPQYVKSLVPENLTKVWISLGGNDVLEAL
ncbi:unnamed protein product [Effrenium voratum]|nr:unnamed protein product [Effrenium voratum]